MLLPPPRRVILSRTDNIGDVVLTLPMAGAIKEAWPDTEVLLLAREYVQPVARACPAVDRFVDWDGLEPLAPAERAMALRRLEADAIIHVFPVRAIAAAARSARIPHRVGTSRRWWHLWTCTRRVRVRRGGSRLHEAQLNLQLLEPWGLEASRPVAALVPLGRLEADAAAVARVTVVLDSDRFSLVLHPGSRGNGREWPPWAYAQLIERLRPERVQILVTGTVAERERLQDVFATGRPIEDLTGRLDLAELIALLAAADGAIASGTGPLHLSAALGRPTLGLFPSEEGPVGSRRWGPIGDRAEAVTGRPACPKCPGPEDCTCMRSVSVARVAGVVERWMAP